MAHEERSVDESTGAMSKEPLRLILIAAVTQANGLGVNGTLAWRLPKEMAHFRKATLNTSGASAEADKTNAVIMGRKTWESIPPKFRPLKDRINVVISRQSGKEAEDALGITEAKDSYLVDSLDAAADLLRSDVDLAKRTHRPFLIGGAQLYTQAMQQQQQAQGGRSWVLDTLLITRILKPAFEECDVFLPEFRSSEQIEQDTSGSRSDNDDSANATFTRVSPETFDSFVGEPVTRDVVEEKGAEYVLQMWTKASA